MEENREKGEDLSHRHHTLSVCLVSVVELLWWYLACSEFEGHG